MNKSDFLIIGSGIAGLSFALKAARTGNVYIITKKAANDSNTSFAQGGIACVLGKDDNVELHIQDTLVAGAGLCNVDAVRTMVYEAKDCIDELLNWGVSFTSSDAHLDLGLEGGHTRKRIVHARDFTGREIENALLAAIRTHKNIRVLENHMAIDLLMDTTSGIKTCRGADVLNQETGEITSFSATNTIICTGGAGQVFINTTNPSIATGDGIAMAHRAGALIANMEFVQFHPTALFNPRGNVFLISEALRGAGAILKNRNGEAFMHRYHLLGSLAPRDITSRAIEKEMKLTGSRHVWLDATHIPSGQLITLFPNIYETCISEGIDITTQMIPVVPSAHFMCGGIVTDLNGSTGIGSLYAFGEAACTGVHGANRLASNSLLEAMVFSNRAFKDIQAQINIVGISPFTPTSDSLNSDENACEPQSENQIKLPAFLKPDQDEVSDLIHDIRLITSRYCGITRKMNDLSYAFEKIQIIEARAKNLFHEFRNHKDVIELYNLSQISRIIITSAIKRKESVGAHYVAKVREYSAAVDTFAAAF